MRVSNFALFAAATALTLAAATGATRADTRIFSVQTDRSGVSITAVQRAGQALPEVGRSGVRTFFEIDAGSAAVPCSNQLAFTASNGQRLEYLVDLCAHNWQVTLPLGTAPAPPPSQPAGARASLTIYTSDSNVGIDEVRLDKQSMNIAARQGNAVAINLSAAQRARCEHDLGLALTDGRRIGRMVDICTPNGAIVVALDGDSAAPVTAPRPIASPPPAAAPPPPPVVMAPPPPPAPSSGEIQIIDNLTWMFGADGNRVNLSYARANSDQIEFFASCNRGSQQTEISLERSAPEVRPGAAVPVTFTAGTFAKTYSASGSDVSALTGISHPELSVPTSDPLWPALIGEAYLVVQIGSAPPFALSLKGSSAAARPFVDACNAQAFVPPPSVPGVPQPPIVGPVGGDYSCAEERTLASQRTNIQSRLIFRNALNRPVQLFWLDYDGRRRPYLSLAPGETGVQPTFFSHFWVVADTSGRCLSIYFARRNDTEIVIGR